MKIYRVSLPQSDYTMEYDIPYMFEYFTSKKSALAFARQHAKETLESWRELGGGPSDYLNDCSWEIESFDVPKNLSRNRAILWALNNRMRIDKYVTKVHLNNHPEYNGA